MTAALKKKKNSETVTNKGTQIESCKKNSCPVKLTMTMTMLGDIETNFDSCFKKNNKRKAAILRGCNQQSYTDRNLSKNCYPVKEVVASFNYVS